MGEGADRGPIAIIAVALCAAALALPGTASAASGADLSPQALFAGTTLSLKKGSTPRILGRIVLAGKVQVPWVNQTVNLAVRREGRLVVSRTVLVNPENGRFHASFRLKGCCDYIAQALRNTDASAPIGLEVHAPRVLRPGREALLFNRLLAGAGYHMGDISDHFDESTGLAILAMRKVNDLPRTEDYDPHLFEMLLRGRGAFEPVHEGSGRYVEVDLSRQVMALIEDGKPTDVFHVSTGAFGTPTGTYAFYEKSPGYNQKGMYYSVYYSGNYATHGYYTVPTYPASHGCVRNPEVYSVFIYDWISLGDPIYIYE
ncbi:MAG: L,D-transpeptidase [Solirubrobacterales bacterium]